MQLWELLVTAFAKCIFLCSGLEKVLGLSALLMLIFANFEFDLAIYLITVCFKFHLFFDSDLW